MSYLSFLHIQCNMGDIEKRIYTYVIFGKREDLIQFPQTASVNLAVGLESVVEFRPVFLFWDKTDEILIGLCESWPWLKKILAAAIKRYIQNKYKEVFLSHPETLFLSEQAERNIAADLWKERPGAKTELHEKYAKMIAGDILVQAEEKNLFWILGEDCRYEELLEWLLLTEKSAGPGVTELFLFGSAEQKENSEEILERFYEETGLAGSFCPVSDCRKEVARAKSNVLMVDCLGLTVDMAGRPAYYVDGTGVRTTKEMKRLSGVCKACYGLRMHLDRAFLSAL